MACLLLLAGTAQCANLVLSQFLTPVYLANRFTLTVPWSFNTATGLSVRASGSLILAESTSNIKQTSLCGIWDIENSTSLDGRLAFASNPSVSCSTGLSAVAGNYGHRVVFATCPSGTDANILSYFDDTQTTAFSNVFATVGTLGCPSYMVISTSGFLVVLTNANLLIYPSITEPSGPSVTFDLSLGSVPFYKVPNGVVIGPAPLYAIYIVFSVFGDSGNTIQIFDPLSMGFTKFASLPIDCNPIDITMNFNTSILFVACRGSNANNAYNNGYILAVTQSGDTLQLTAKNLGNLANIVYDWNYRGNIYFTLRKSVGSDPTGNGQIGRISYCTPGSAAINQLNPFTECALCSAGQSSSSGFACQTCNVGYYSVAGSLYLISRWAMLPIWIQFGLGFPMFSLLGRNLLFK